MIVLLSCSVAALATNQAYAQPGSPQTESIDSLVWNSDYVLIAKIEKLHPERKVEKYNGHEVTIAIAETVKDPPLTETQPRMSFHFPQAETVLADWKKRDCQLLVAYDEYYPANTTVIELTPSKMEIMTADFQLLREPEAVLKAAREAAHRQPIGIKRIHTFRLSVPRQLVTGTIWDKYYDASGTLMLSVPVDERLKKRAEAYLKNAENSSQQYEGKEAMRYFKSGKTSTP